MVQRRRVERGLTCSIHKGNQWDAFVYGATDNAKHGVRLTSPDKRYIVDRFLDEPLNDDKSAREIGRLAGVHHSTVSQIISERIAAEAQDNSQGDTSCRTPDGQEDNSNSQDGGAASNGKRRTRRKRSKYDSSQAASGFTSIKA